MMLLRCRTDLKGLTTFLNPIADRCQFCGGRQWVGVTALTLGDRWRLWRHLGLSPWTTPTPLPV